VPGAASGSPGTISVVGDTLYFGTNGSANRQVWKSDGTPAGTVVVTNFAGNLGSSLDGRLQGVGDVLYFPGTDAATGTELWRSDGTDAGTHIVRDLFNPGSANPTELTDFNGTLV